MARKGEEGHSRAGRKATQGRFDAVDALSSAIKGKDYKVLSHLLKDNPKLNGRNSDGDTLLSLAAITSDITAVKALLAAGAKVNSKTKTKQTALAQAVLHQGATEQLLHLLIDHYADPDGGIRRYTMQTPLMMAVGYGEEHIARLLLARGANVNAQGPQGETALMIAARDGNIVLAKLLLDHSASLELSSLQRQTPILAAVERGHSKMIKLLQEAGALINGRPSSGRRTPALFSQKHRLNMVQTILANGADKQRDKFDDSSSSTTAQVDIVEALVNFASSDDSDGSDSDLIKL